MPDARLYSDTVALLAESSANHACALSGMTLAGRPGDLPHPADLDSLTELARRIEDVAINAVCSLAVLADTGAALEAIGEARAGWLVDVILNRAAESTEISAGGAGELG